MTIGQGNKSQSWLQDKATRVHHDYKATRVHHDYKARQQESITTRGQDKKSSPLSEDKCPPSQEDKATRVHITEDKATRVHITEDKATRIHHVHMTRQQASTRQGNKSPQWPQNKATRVHHDHKTRQQESIMTTRQGNKSPQWPQNKATGVHHDHRTRQQESITTTKQGNTTHSSSRGHRSLFLLLLAWMWM